MGNNTIYYYLLNAHELLEPVGIFTKKELLQKVKNLKASDFYKYVYSQKLVDDTYYIVEADELNEKDSIEVFHAAFLGETDTDYIYQEDISPYSLLFKNKVTHQEKKVTWQQKEFDLNGEIINLPFKYSVNFEHTKPQRKEEKKMSNELNEYMQQNERQEQMMNIYAIRYNPLNFYRKELHQNEDSEECQEFIEMAAENYRSKAQTQPLEVYYDDSLGDDKCFTLISGEKRLRAAIYNHQHGYGSDKILVLIRPKPKDKEEELLWIMEANDQTIFSKDVQLQVIENFYNILSQQHPDWSYTKLSNVIAPKAGYTSGRQVRNKLKDLGILSPEAQRKADEEKENEIPIYVDGQQYDENQDFEEETEDPVHVTYGDDQETQIESVKTDKKTALQENVGRAEEAEIQQKNEADRQKEENIAFLTSDIADAVQLEIEQIKLNKKGKQIHLEFVANDLDEFKALLFMLGIDKEGCLHNNQMLESLR